MLPKLLNKIVTKSNLIIAISVCLSIVIFVFVYFSSNNVEGFALFKRNKTLDSIRKAFKAVKAVTINPVIKAIKRVLPLPPLPPLPKKAVTATAATAATVATVASASASASATASIQAKERPVSRPEYNESEFNYPRDQPGVNQPAVDAANRLGSLKAVQDAYNNIYSESGSCNKKIKAANLMKGYGVSIGDSIQTADLVPCQISVEETNADFTKRAAAAEIVSASKKDLAESATTLAAFLTAKAKRTGSSQDALEAEIAKHDAENANVLAKASQKLAQNLKNTKDIADAVEFACRGLKDKEECRKVASAAASLDLASGASLKELMESARNAANSLIETSTSNDISSMSAEDEISGVDNGSGYYDTKGKRLCPQNPLFCKKPVSESSEGFINFKDSLSQITKIGIPVSVSANQASKLKANAKSMFLNAKETIQRKVTDFTKMSKYELSKLHPNDLAKVPYNILITLSPLILARLDPRELAKLPSFVLAKLPKTSLAKLPPHILHTLPNAACATCIEPAPIVRPEQGLSSLAPKEAVKMITAVITAGPPPANRPGESSQPGITDKGCEGDTTTLTCLSGIITGVKFKYGKWNRGSCPGANSNTRTKKFTDKIIKPTQCMGQQTCTIKMDNSLGGDPFGGTRKEWVAVPICSRSNR